MGIVSHWESLWAEDLPLLGPLARLGIEEGAAGPVLVVHDPAARAQASVALPAGSLGAASWTREDLRGDTRAVALDGGARTLDGTTLDRLAAQPGSAALHLDGLPFQGNLVALASLEIGGQDWLALGYATGAGLRLMRLDAGGAPLSQAWSVPDDAGRALAGIAGLAGLSAHGHSWLLAASWVENGVTALRLDASGRPTVTGTMSAGADELPVSRPSAIGAATLGGEAFAILASAGSSSLTVLELGADGRLSFRDQVIDTVHSRFADVAALATLTHGGRVYVAAGGSDGGVTLLELLPGGRLLHRDTLVDGLGTALAGVTDLRFVLNRGQPELWVLSGGEGGLARLRLDLGPAGSTTAATAGDDRLAAPAAGGRLDGGAGDDVLLDGAGRDILMGGAGADLFVFRPDGAAVDSIAGFDPREDRIDLTGYDGLHGPGAIRITSNATGARLLWGDETLVLLSASGGPLTAAQVAGALRFDVNRVGMPDSASFLTLRGGDGADSLVGTTTGETFLGGGGADWITPGEGSDSVDGDTGTDMASFADLPLGVNASLRTGLALSGGDTDRLRGIENLSGTAHADTLEGDAGPNLLRGLGHYDWFLGSGGGDTFDGGAGRDMVSYMGAPGPVTVDLGLGRGTAGQAAGDRYIGIERVTGSSHADLLIGSAGEDELRGLGGNDWFVGSGGGRDRYDGGSGADTVTYFASRAGVSASLAAGGGSRGDAAQDLYAAIENLTGSSHADWLGGDGGRNLLRGLAGADTLLGLEGNDRLEGGAGDDRLDGGAGWDVAIFAGPRSAYAITRANGAVLVDAPGAEGTDRLLGIEAIQFADGLLYL